MQMNFMEFCKNLEGRGFTRAQVLAFIKFTPDGQILGVKSLDTWNLLLDEFLLRNENGESRN